MWGAYNRGLCYSIRVSVYGAEFGMMFQVTYHFVEMTRNDYYETCANYVISPALAEILEDHGDSCLPELQLQC